MSRVGKEYSGTKATCTDVHFWPKAVTSTYESPNPLSQHRDDSSVSFHRRAEDVAVGQVRYCDPPDRAATYLQNRKLRVFCRGKIFLCRLT